MELKRVVVTGLGAVTPVGLNVEETWNNLVNGVSGAAPITHFDCSKFKTQFACEVKGLNVNEWIDRKEARKLDRHTQLAIISAIQAVDDSGMNLETIDKNRVGVVFGVGIGGIKTFEDEVAYYAKNEENGPKFGPFFIPKMISDIASGHISIRYGFHGPNYTTTSACASSTNALADAFNLIRLGKANVIVSGGAEAAICACGVGGFNAMHALSTRNDEPQKASRPFSASRDGFIMAEGAGCLILEELEHAKARGAKIYAEMVGEGESADAYHITASHPEGLGAKLVMERALADANLGSSGIGLYWMQFSKIMSATCTDPNSHIRQALEQCLKAEIVNDWKPSVPVEIYSAPNDNVIPFSTNAQATYDKLKAAGADVKLTLGAETFDHMTGQVNWMYRINVLKAYK